MELLCIDLITYLAPSQASVISSNALLRLMDPSVTGSLHVGHFLLESNQERIHCGQCRFIGSRRPILKLLASPPEIDDCSR
jgi:hypothetical protein